MSSSSKFTGGLTKISLKADRLWWLVASVAQYRDGDQKIQPFPAGQAITESNLGWLVFNNGYHLSNGGITSYPSWFPKNRTHAKKSGIRIIIKWVWWEIISYHHIPKNVIPEISFQTHSHSEIVKIIIEIVKKNQNSNLVTHPIPKIKSHSRIVTHPYPSHFMTMAQNDQPPIAGWFS